jgi:hypothetical protein
MEGDDSSKALGLEVPPTLLKPRALPQQRRCAILSVGSTRGDEAMKF